MIQSYPERTMNGGKKMSGGSGGGGELGHIELPLPPRVKGLSTGVGTVPAY